MLEQLLNSSLIKTAYQIVKSNKQDIFLVGGALRDLYLTGSIPKDLDFLVTNNVKSLVHVFSHSYHGSFFCLDRKRECYRVLIEHHDNYMGRKKPSTIGRKKRSEGFGYKTYHPRGLFRSSNGFIVHSDVNGAFNIGRKAFPDIFNRNTLSISNMLINPITAKIY